MINCTCRIYATTAMLKAGQRTGDQSSLLYAGPAYLSSPSRSWQKAAALEGVFAGTLHVHTRTDLSAARRIEIAENIQAGTWDVAEAGTASAGTQWNIPLSRRKFTPRPPDDAFGSAGYGPGQYADDD